MSITPIPEKEAADMLGITLRTIRNAVDRGDLMRIPGTGILQHVAKEQVELFIGKNWIVKGKLSSSDLKKWEAVTEAIASPNTSHQDTHDPLAEWISQMPRTKGMRQRVTVENEPMDEREVPKGVPFLQKRE